MAIRSRVIQESEGAAQTSLIILDSLQSITEDRSRLSSGRHWFLPG